MRIRLFFIFFLLINCNLFANPFKLSDVSLITKKRGVYIGYERGLYDVAGFGIEFQRKKTGFKNSHAQALLFGVNYNIKYNILGYDFSYWRRDGIVGLTYGADAIITTDFKKMNYGLAPTIGCRFSGFHLQTGYKFLTDRSGGVEVNRFFIRLRFTIQKKTNRDIKWD